MMMFESLSLRSSMKKRTNEDLGQSKTRNSVITVMNRDGNGLGHLPFSLQLPHAFSINSAVETLQRAHSRRSLVPGSRGTALNAIHFSYNTGTTPVWLPCVVREGLSDIFG